ncbi:MAG TPA: SulP family inorganic anion transporter, partial [Flavisolibacter sp.]
MGSFKLTKGDFFGGLTAGIVALPLALAFGMQSGMGAAAGLYGAIFLGFFAALLGGTPSQISGPTGPMTVVSAAVIASMIAATGSLESSLGAIVACFILAGLFQVLMGILKIGSLIKYIPYPVISGFMSGIGVIIILLQVFAAIGQSSPPSTIDVVKTIGPALSNINTWALIYASITIAIIYIFPRFTKAIPSTLVALVVVTILSVVLEKQVPVIGEIPQGFPDLAISGLTSISPGFYYLILE